MTLRLNSIAKALIVATPFVIGSCRLLPQKKQEQGKAASIDAILNNNVLADHNIPCGMGDATELTTDSEIAFNNAYAAAPKFLQKMFPKEGIQRHPLPNETVSIEAICKSAADQDLAIKQSPELSAKTGQLLSCSVVDTVNGQLGPVIHIKNDAKVINANLIRTMAWAYSNIAELLKDKAVTVDEKSPFYPITLQEFNSRKRILVEAFLLDLSQGVEGGATILQKYKDFYSTPGKELLDSPLLQNFLFSEMTDSYYCAPAAKAEFRQARFMTSVCRYHEFVDLMKGQGPQFDLENKAQDCPAQASATPPTAATATPTP